MSKMQPSRSPGDAQTAERRQFSRMVVPKGVPIEAELITSNHVRWRAQCLDVSSEGALIAFPDGQCPQVDVEDKVFLHLRLAGEEAKLPAIVKSRFENRIGLYLPPGALCQAQDDEEAFFRILRTLDRAILRRKLR